MALMLLPCRRTIKTSMAMKVFMLRIAGILKLLSPDGESSIEVNERGVPAL
jgi:hypothetical protein